MPVFHQGNMAVPSSSLSMLISSIWILLYFEMRNPALGSSRARNEYTLTIASGLFLAADSIAHICFGEKTGRVIFASKKNIEYVFFFSILYLTTLITAIKIKNNVMSLIQSLIDLISLKVRCVFILTTITTKIMMIGTK